MSKSKESRPTSKKRNSAASSAPHSVFQDSSEFVDSNGGPSAAAQDSNGSAVPEKGAAPFNLTDKIKELVRLSQEQGYLTYNDINEALPDSVISPEALDEIYIKLRGLEVEIVDQAEVDRVKQAEPEEEDEKARLDILDDPVRMYLKQMGQVPWLTREQEVEISKRLESEENEIKAIIYSLGFAGKEHIALAEKLVSEPPKERFDRVILDKKVAGRENHVRALRKLIKDTRDLDLEVDANYAEWQNGGAESHRRKIQRRLTKLEIKLKATFGSFYYKQKVIEEMTLVAENIHDKLQLSLRLVEQLEDLPKGAVENSEF